MARQKGIIKLEGSIGDVSFYKSKDGYLAREKGGIDADRIKNDPAFQRTRENGSEFGRAGRAGSTLRTAFRPLLLRTADSRVTSRLTKQMLTVIRSDTENARGERTVLGGNLDLLENFEFNNAGKLAATLYTPFDVAVDRAAGTGTIALPAFVPMNSIAYPQGATHLKLMSAVAEIDFETDEFTYSAAESEPIAITAEETEETQLQSQFTANSDKAVFLVFGIEFYQEVNAQMYAMKNGSFNCLALVHVEGPEPVEQT